MRIRIEAIVDSAHLDEGDVAELVDVQLGRHFEVADLSVYQIVDLPSDAERRRRERAKQWKPLLSSG